MEEDAAVAVKRAKLKGEKERLRLAIERLDKLAVEQGTVDGI